MPHEHQLRPCHSDDPRREKWACECGQYRKIRRDGRYVTIQDDETAHIYAYDEQLAVKVHHA